MLHDNEDLATQRRETLSRRQAESDAAKETANAAEQSVGKLEASLAGAAFEMRGFEKRIHDRLQSHNVEREAAQAAAERAAATHKEELSKVIGAAGQTPDNVNELLHRPNETLTKYVGDLHASLAKEKEVHEQCIAQEV